MYHLSFIRNTGHTESISNGSKRVSDRQITCKNYLPAGNSLSDMQLVCLRASNRSCGAGDHILPKTTTTIGTHKHTHTHKARVCVCVFIYLMSVLLLLRGSFLVVAAAAATTTIIISNIMRGGRRPRLRSR